MLQLSLPERMIHFIFNLLMLRTIQVRSSKDTPTRLVFKGLPQGSVLSPLLYSIYTWDLDKSIPSYCSVLQYADDIALYASSDNMDVITFRLNSALAYLENWMSDHGLSLSPSKSNVVVFSKKRLIPQPVILLENSSIPVVNKIKFLGVVLDQKLNGMAHTNYISQKCEKGINVLRSLSGVWWGSHPYCQKLVYNAIIRSHLDYASFILEPCNKTALVKLDRIQYKCLRLIIGAMKSTPVNALQVECVDPPLSLRRQYLADKYFFRLIQLSSHPLLPKIRNLLQILTLNNLRCPSDFPCLLKSLIKFNRLPDPTSQFSIHPLYSTPFHALVFIPNINVSCGIQKRAPDSNIAFNCLVSSYWHGYNVFFTDASKVSKHLAVGVAVWHHNSKTILQFKCPPLSSVFTGEATAILEALNFIDSHNLQNSVIFSDSLSCLQTITSNPFRSKSKFPIIFRIKSALYNCFRKGLQVDLVHIPSHSGIIGNEKADILAKSAIQHGTLEHYSNYAHDLSSLSKDRLDCTWNSQWKNSNKGKFYRDIQPSIPRYTAPCKKFMSK
ncbi:uncharacterized protein LOC123694256 [Colias croceus]|uniref:uncharacterized protein LOC123694256 n=1 Tax=Colias crocea TaxID=72248 RepID=UPI001E27FEFC|nr:uncharacterized protein LOC123694256 [Colias croceus]